MYEGPIQDLIDELSRLPGIGPKSAQRLAFHLVKAPSEDAKRLSEAVLAAKERIFFCKEWGNVAEGELCRICRDEGRDRTMLCVVEEPKDISTIEKAGVIKGRYHVLGGVLVFIYMWLPVSKRLYQRNPEHLANRVEVVGLFWHFVDLVWIFVFPLFYLL